MDVPSWVNEEKGTGSSPTDNGIWDEILLLMVFAAALLLFLGNLNLAGSLGRLLREYQLGLLGTLGYAFPFYLVWIGCFVYMNVKNHPGNTLLKLAASFVTLTSACGLAELVGGRQMGGYLSLAQCFALSSDGLNGGWFGGLYYLGLYPVFGVLGTYVILILILVIGFVVTTGKSLILPVSQQGKRVMDSAREHGEIRREESKLRREEARLRREEEKLLREERALEQEARRRSLDVRRTELVARSLRFGEETLIDSDSSMEAEEDTTYINMNEPGETTSGKKMTAEEIEAMDITRPTSRRRRDYMPRKDKRTLAELDALDEGGIPKEPQTPPVADSPEEIISLEEEFGQDTPAATVSRPEPVIHLHTDVKRAEYDTPEDAGSQNSVDPFMAGAEENWQSPEDEGMAGAGESWESPADEGMAGAGESWQSPEEDIRTNRENTRQSFAEGNPPTPVDSVNEETDDGMSAYDEFPKDAVPSPWELEMLQEEQNTAGGKKPGTPKGADRAGSGTGSESIWRQGDAKEQSSGATFTKAAPITVETAPEPIEYHLPSVDLLERGKSSSTASVEKLRQTAAKLQQTLENFGVRVTVTDISCGPSVTRYELHPDQGVKVSRIVSLQDDIKLNLAVADIRIEAPIPGKAAVGIEVPNEISETVYLSDVLDSGDFKKASSKISFAVGKGISGDVVVTDLARMPHLLIAGATGSGKSVCINTIIMSILFKAKPEEVRMIMIDPKMVELSVYNGIPHLLIPVVTDPKQASAALNWAVAEMSDRYKKFADEGVRDIRGYNKKLRESGETDEKPLPQIVVIVDEMADLMMVAAGEVEDAICRLAQLARAAGIHLVLATQRPSVNVITGLIKANVQSRIAFAVSSGIDSRTILDMNGAEKLLGKGDMLFYPSNYPKPVRIQGAFVSDDDVQKVVDFWKAQTDGKPLTNRAVEQQIAASSKDNGTVGAGERDELFEKAGRFIIEKEKASIGNLQRVFRIGFNRAARIMDQLADYGVVGPDEGTKAREILMTIEEFDSLMSSL